VNASEPGRPCSNYTLDWHCNLRGSPCAWTGSECTNIFIVEEDEDDGLSPGAIAGIAVGGTAFLVLVGYCIYYFLNNDAKTGSSSTSVGSLIF